MKIFEENLTNNKSNRDCLHCKRDLSYIHQKLEGIKTKRKCN